MEGDRKAYTLVGQKDVREACWQAARELRASVEEDLEDLSDRDFLSPYCVPALAERLSAASEAVRWAAEQNIGMLCQEINREIERRGPLPHGLLAGLVRECAWQKAHAAALMVDGVALFEAQRDLKECLEAAWDEEVRLDPGREAHVPTLAAERAQAASIGQVDAHWAGLVAEELGIELSGEEKEALAQFAADNLWESEAVGNLVHDQLESEISNYAEERGETATRSNEPQVVGGIETGLADVDRANGARSHGGR